MAAAIPVFIECFERRILDADIGRIRDYRMILLAQNSMEFFTVLDLIEVLRLIREHIVVSGQ